MGRLDELADPQLAALATLLVGGVNAELSPDPDDEPVIRRGYTWPIGTGKAPELQLPALAVYRLQERGRRRSMRGPFEHEVTFRFDYVVSATPLDRMQLRWPLLRNVWRQLYLIVEAGQHEDVAANAELLKVAGIVAIDRDSPTVRYFAPTDENAHPRFEATIVLTHREEYDRSGLAEFLELAGNVNRADGNAALQPQVQFLADEDDG